jgi:glutathione S-transferase
MRLIGMMDSPYVRRVAVSLKVMGLKFDHDQISVFRHFDTFAAINPVVKAPTLVTDDGVVLMDSTLILQHVEQLAPPERRLTPGDLGIHARSQRIIGLALAACEKTVQLIYERNLRPPEKQHEPWVDRVRGQMLSAYTLLEAELGEGTAWLFGTRPLNADITAAVAWAFSNFILPEKIDGKDFPALTRFSRRAEALPEFASSPME